MIDRPTEVNANQIVRGEGPADAAVMLIGQNPGREEVRRGKPFVGRSGRYLDEVLRRNGLERRKFYITGVVKEPTPGNRMPSAAQVKRWMPVLLEEICQIKPKVIVLMGRLAWRVPRSEGIEYIETYHPAAAMRFPVARLRFESDFARIKALLIEHGIRVQG